VLNTIIGGLLLPFELYFRPQAFRRRVNPISPGLLSGYTLSEAISGFKDPVIRRRITKIFLQFFIALLWLPVLSYVIYLLIPNSDWSQIQSGLFTLPALALGLGIGIALEADLALGIAISVGAGVIFGGSSSFYSAVLSSVSNSTGLEIGFVVDRGLARENLALGTGIFNGLLIAIVGGILSVRWMWLIGLIVGVALIGWAYNSSTPLLINSPLLSGIILTVCLTHLLFLPFQFALAIGIWFFSLLPPSDLLYGLWCLFPLRWDEFLVMPLPGSADLLAKLYKHDPVYGQLAIDHVTRHPFQSWVARRATKRIETDEGWN
jgi:hypothetical protein